MNGILFRSRRSRGGLLLFVILLAFPAFADVAQKLPHPKGYVAYRTFHKIWVEGDLNEPGWQAAPWSEAFVDIEGDAKPVPRHETRVKMLWDNAYLYIGAELVEPHLWATLKEHDSVIFRDNDFEVFIDPNGDNHEYYELEINALGTTWDLFLPKPYKDGGKAVDAFEINGMKSAVKLNGTLNDPRDTDRSWTVELALPWTAFQKPPSMPKNGDRWRINFSRVQWQLERQASVYQKVANTKEDNWVWSPQGVIDMHRPERWGYLHLSTKTSGPVVVMPNPEQDARDFLHAVYYAQRDFRKVNGRWATSLAELGANLQLPAGVTDPSLVATNDQFEVTVYWVTGRKRLSIRHDALIR
jgi:Carbohydrate family 9 binding domain-like